MSWFVVAFVVALLDAGEDAFAAPFADVALGGGLWDVEASGISDGEEVLVEEGEALSFPDFIPKIPEPFIAHLVLFAQVGASG